MVFLFINQSTSSLWFACTFIFQAMENAVAYAVVPGAVIHLVGSSINGFGRLNSDADMCLVLDPTQNTLKVEYVLF